MKHLAVVFLMIAACTQRPLKPNFGHNSGDLDGARPEEVAGEANEDEKSVSPGMGDDNAISPSDRDPGTPDDGSLKNPDDSKKPDESIPADPTKPEEPKKPEDPKPEPKAVLNLANGIYTIQNAASKKCLEVTSSEKSTSIVQFGCNGSRIQAFKVEALGKQEFKIVNIDTKKAFDINSSSKVDGAALNQMDFANGDNQAFIIDFDANSDSLVNIRPKHSLKFLEIPDSSMKSKMQPKQSAENKKDNQRWKLTKISEPTSAQGVRYYFVNECEHDVWVGTQPNPGFPVPANDGFKLANGAYNNIDTDSTWDGRFWGRYNCKMVNGKLSCESGQCAKGEKCGDTHGEPPVSLAEFKTNGFSNLDFYDISLVDGANLPMDIRPMPLTLKADGAAGSCKHLECKSDLRLDCPAELQRKNAAGQIIGCLSACERFRTDEYCCRGAYAAPNCQPSNYAKWFDQKCPDAYSFAEDTKTFTCRNADYEIIFCPK